uniref:Uncharacterized protein n=1 Tax=Eptatretus burgeri TaxID=7764 RepID=A0A8C4NGU4_EPTBU
MGMPGSETALGELMCRVLGDLLEKGAVAKLADDLCCGGDTLDELLQNWRMVLQALRKCRLRLCATKTAVCPKSTTILGWIWSNGTIQVSPHRVATLYTCSAPEKVRGMRSFIGAYKVLARVIPNCSALLSPLDDVVAGCQSLDRVVWTDELHSAFHRAQAALLSTRTITLPRPSDQLLIVTDGSVKKHSIGWTTCCHPHRSGSGTRLVHDELLKHHRMCIEIGHIKNPNKNPIAEKAVRECEDELLRQEPMGGPVTPLTLALATASMNSRVRAWGLSAREMWCQRDQFTNQQIPFSDLQVIQAQHHLRSINHPHIEKSKAPTGSVKPNVSVEVGDLIYLYSDRNKSCAKNRYLVSAIDGPWCNIHKFVGSQLRSAAYRVKKSECYKVPDYWKDTLPLPRNRGYSVAQQTEDLCLQPATKPPDTPFIPYELSSPADSAESFPSPSSQVPDLGSDASPRLDTSRPGYSKAIGDTCEEHPTVSPTVWTPKRSNRVRYQPKHFKNFILDASSHIVVTMLAGTVMGQNNP